jgi:hypothetical protein
VSALDVYLESFKRQFRQVKRRRILAEYPSKMARPGSKAQF